MNSEENRKRLERQARALILKKDISPEDRDKINFLMRNQSISQEERYTGIINVLKKAPDKEISDINDEDELPDMAKPAAAKKPSAPPAKKQQVVPQQGARKYPDVNGPTETKLFIDEIYFRYKKYKLFKKKYLARRDNRLGFGWSKRLIPTKKYLMLISDIRSYQENILSRLPQILERVLKDESIETPLEFNFLRQLRRWMIVSPFLSTPYDRIKWMEQWDFERQFKSYVVYFQSFLRVDVETRELVIAMIEKFLREEPDLVKEDILENDDRGATIRKDNENFRREKYIFEYLGAVRSFMAIHGEADSLLAAFLKKKYEIQSLEDLLNITVEALVFQRPFSGSELREYFEIRPMSVSSEIWDLNSARLKIYGKDPESKRIKKVEKLRKELLWYDAIYHILKIDDNGQNILVRSAEEQWKYVDRINRDAEDCFKNNFVVFLEGIVYYFKNLLIPLLNGKPLLFDYYGETVEGAIFSQDFFLDEIKEIESLAADIYKFRNVNPTLKISEEETKKIIAGKIPSMNHVEGVIFKTGSSFYAAGARLHEAYYNHAAALEKEKKTSLRTIPLCPADRDSAAFIPYSPCLFKGFEPDTPLLKRIAGRKVLNESMKGGVVIFIMAYCYQAAFLCGYPQIQNDLMKRDLIRKEIIDLSGESDDTKK